MNAFSTLLLHCTHSRFSSLTPARLAVHGSKPPVESTTAQTSPAAVNFASSESDKLVFPEPPATSTSVPRVRASPKWPSNISSAYFCSSCRRERLCTKLKCGILKSGHLCETWLSVASIKQQLNDN